MSLPRTSKVDTFQILEAFKIFKPKVQVMQVMQVMQVVHTVFKTQGNGQAEHHQGTYQCHLYEWERRCLPPWAQRSNGPMVQIWVAWVASNGTVIHLKFLQCLIHSHITHYHTPNNIITWDNMGIIWGY